MLLPALAQAETVQYCILFGVGEEEPASWDGSIEATGARIVDVWEWRLGRDHSAAESRWRLATRRLALTRSLNDARRYPELETGVYGLAETLATDARFRIRTEHGDTSFDAADVAFGKPAVLMEGRVTVERIPIMRVLTSSQGEQDLPSVAVHGDTAYLV